MAYILKSSLVCECVASTSGNLEEAEHLDSDRRNNMELVDTQLAAVAVPGHNLDSLKEPRCTFLEVDPYLNQEVLVEIAEDLLELNSLPSPASSSNLHRLT